MSCRGPPRLDVRALHLADSLIVGGGAGLWCARVVCSVLLCYAKLTSMFVVW